MNAKTILTQEYATRGTNYLDNYGYEHKPLKIIKKKLSQHEKMTLKLKEIHGLTDY